MSDGKKTIAYRPPYRWEELIRFFAERSISGVEMVKDGKYHRTVHLVDNGGNHVYGWFEVSHRPQKNKLAVTVNDTLIPLLPLVFSRVRRQFDLDCHPFEIMAGLSSMSGILPGLPVPGTRLPGCFDPFEMAVRAVLGQQITVKAAGTLAGRLARTFGTPVQTGIEGLDYAFPMAETILSLEGQIENHLGSLGIISARAKTILELARAAVRGTVNCTAEARPEEEIKKLMEIPGIGPWTAQYIALRAMKWADAFPHTDYGIKKALAPRTPKEILALAEAWRPWRAYGAINLWNSL